MQVKYLFPTWASKEKLGKLFLIFLMKLYCTRHMPCMFFFLAKHGAEDPAEPISNPTPMCATPGQQTQAGAWGEKWGMSIWEKMIL